MLECPTSKNRRPGQIQILQPQPAPFFLFFFLPFSVLHAGDDTSFGYLFYCLTFFLLLSLTPLSMPILAQRLC